MRPKMPNWRRGGRIVGEGGVHQPLRPRSSKADAGSISARSSLSVTRGAASVYALGQGGGSRGRDPSRRRTGPQPDGVRFAEGRDDSARGVLRLRRREDFAASGLAGNGHHRGQNGSRGFGIRRREGCFDQVTRFEKRGQRGEGDAQGFVEPAHSRRRFTKAAAWKSRKWKRRRRPRRFRQRLN